MNVGTLPDDLLHCEDATGCNHNCCALVKSAQIVDMAITPYQPNSKPERDI